METQSFFIGMLGIIGACIGSYLNVVIYRIPRGQSVNHPKRSYCPSCKIKIPFYRNIPIVTWVLQKAKCHACQNVISYRYIIVELLTSALFVALWFHSPGHTIWSSCLLASLLITISFIDAEHYIIPVNWCWWGVLIAGGLNFFCPTLISDEGGDLLIYVKSFFKLNTVDTSFLLSCAGALLGFLSLSSVVLVGKLVFGTITHTSEEEEQWSLKEPEGDQEELTFVYGEHAYSWSEVFYRATDRIEMYGTKVKVDGELVDSCDITITEDGVTLGEAKYDIVQLKSLEGLTKKVTIPREAMGGGDPPLLAMIGAFLGPYAVIFTLFASSIFALIFALFSRLGFGRPLPYGPFLAMGALSWIFGGAKVFQWYLDLVK